MLFVKKMSKNIGRHKISRQPDVQVDKILGLISSFFYKLRKNAFGIFPICSDGQKSSQIANLPALLFFLQKNSIFNLLVC